MAAPPSQPRANAPITQAESAGPPSLAPAAPDAPTVTLYDQYNNVGTGHIESQDYEATYNAYDSFAADDFVVPGGPSWSITGVDVDGDYLLGAPPGPAASVNVFFYSNGGGNLPGALVASRSAQGYVQGPAAGDFVVGISPAVTLSPGTYWISVQTRQDYVCCGQWGWQLRAVQSNSGAAWQNPGNGFARGCTAWTRMTTCIGGNPDLVFRLNGTIGGQPVLYDQYNNGPAGFTTTSQDYDAAADSFDSFAADDFVVPGGASWSVTGVDVDGQYANGPGPAASVHVLFYANGAGNLPGTLVASRSAQAYVQGPAAGDFVVTISPAVTLNSGAYWISVRARQDYGCCGGWFWQNRSVQANSGAAWQNPANGWGTGCTAWTRRTTCLMGGGGYPDQVFRLIGTAGSPTAVALSFFTTRAASAGIIVSWRTAAEVSTLGFNLYRQRHGKLVKLNRALIPSVFGGTTSGHAYSFLDRSARRGVKHTYRLQAVSLGGTRAWLGTAVARR